MGVGYTNLEEDEEAEEAYQRAIEINSETMLAWQGLISFYEKRGKHDKLAAVLQDLLPKAVQRYLYLENSLVHNLNVQ